MERATMDEASSERDYEKQNLIPKSSKRPVESDEGSSYEEDDNDDDESTVDGQGALTVKETFLVTVLNIVKVTVGGTLPFLSHGMKAGGWTTLGVLFGTMVVSGYCAILLGRLQTLKARMLLSYRDIAGRSLGKGLSFFVLLMMMLQIFFCLVLGLTTSAVAFRTLDVDYTTEFSFVCCCLIVVGFLILTNLVDTGLLGGLANLIPYGYSLFMFSANFMSEVEKPDSSEIVSFTSEDSIPTLFGLFMFCLAAHYTYPTIKGKMQEPDRWDDAVLVSFTIIFLIYVFTGVSSYLAFGDDLMYCGLLNFTKQKGIKVLLIILLTQGLMAFAETLNPFARVLEVYVGVSKLDSPAKYLVSSFFRITLVALVFAVGYPIKELYGTTTTIVGVVFCCFTTIIFPVGCYMYSHWNTHIPLLERIWLLLILIGSLGLVVWNLELHLPVLFGFKHDGSPDY